MRGIIYGLSRPIYKASITTHCEITCFVDWIGPAILVESMASGNELCWVLGINCVMCQVSMVPVTGVRQVIGAKWHQGRGIYERMLAGFALDRLFSIIGFPHGDFLLAGFCRIAAG